MPEICLRPAFHEGLCIPKTCEEKDPAKSVPESSVGQPVSAGGTESGATLLSQARRRWVPRNEIRLTIMTNRPTILITDDSEMNREILKESLGMYYRILEADNGATALEVLRANPGGIDLLLLDINMPVMDGMEVMRRMRNDDVETVPVIVISAELDPSTVHAAYELGATDYLQRSFDMVVVQRRVINTLNLYARQKHLAKLLADQVYEKEKLSSMMINILSHVVEVRNQESGLHVVHVRTAVGVIGRKLREISDKYPMTEAEITMTAMASALHDIGKIKVPEAVLNKKGKFTPEEWNLMKMHTIYGEEILQKMQVHHNEPLILLSEKICRWHHERWDGGGYPDGLKGDEIPICAQLVAMADVYDALTSDRVYKKAYSHEEAIAMIQRGECGAFNPLLVQALVASQDELREALAMSVEDADSHKVAQRLIEELLNTPGGG